MSPPSPSTARLPVVSQFKFCSSFHAAAGDARPPVTILKRGEPVPASFAEALAGRPRPAASIPIATQAQDEPQSKGAAADKLEPSPAQKSDSSAREPKKRKGRLLRADLSVFLKVCDLTSHLLVASVHTERQTDRADACQFARACTSANQSVCFTSAHEPSSSASARFHKKKRHLEASTKGNRPPKAHKLSKLKKVIQKEKLERKAKASHVPLLENVNSTPLGLDVYLAAVTVIDLQSPSWSQQYVSHVSLSISQL